VLRTTCRSASVRASRSSAPLPIPAQPVDAGTGMRTNDGARFGRPVLHAVESLLDPFAEDVSALGAVGVHGAGVDSRAGRNALLDELLEAFHAALACADPVDKDAVAVLHLDDGLDRKERAERGLRPRDPAPAAQVLERVDQGEALNPACEPPRHGDRLG